MTRHPAACAALLLVLASGCAARHEDARNEAAPASEREDEAPTQDQPAAEPEPAAPADDLEDSPRSFDEIQRELATNNAKLRELGVELPGSPKSAEPEAGDATGTKKTVTGESGRSATTTSPSGKPGAKPSKSGGDGVSPKRDKADRKAKDEAKGELGGSVRPDAAQATPMPPVDGGLDAAARCQQVCDLAAISCGLGDQICELADRHPEQPDYLSACERANADCEAAKGACDACVE